MFHDRVSFGGALIAIGTLYLWLTEFPLREGRAWAWWTLALSGTAGFASFLTYLGYGYLDTWHGVATLVLLPCFIVGLIRSWNLLKEPRGIASLRTPAAPLSLRTRGGIGRAVLLATATGLIGGGLTIMTVGMTSVFVPQDLNFMGVQAADLHALNPRLVPLIAHDRAGFGGGVAACGVIVLLCVWCSPMTRSLWQAMAFAGFVGFACAVGVHPVIGYNDTMHLAPAVLGAAAFGVGMILPVRGAKRGRSEDRSKQTATVPTVNRAISRGR
jgi:hypothetical protein